MWNDPRWIAYFTSRYLREKDVSPEDFSVPRLISSTWHFGSRSDAVPGHGPSQQPPEQGHSTLKRAIKAIDPAATFEQVMDKVEQVAGTLTA